jgi:hypothetical protein
MSFSTVSHFEGRTYTIDGVQEIVVRRIFVPKT